MCYTSEMIKTRGTKWSHRTLTFKHKTLLLMDVLDIFPRVLVYCLSGSHESYVDELWSCLTPIAAIIIIIRGRVQRGKVALSETAAFAWGAQ